MSDYLANTRIPFRPLSYDFVEKAYNREIIVDYEKAEIYLKDKFGILHNFTQSITKLVSELIKEDPSIVLDSVIISIPNPDGTTTEMTIDKAVIESIRRIILIEGDISNIKNDITNINGAIVNINTKLNEIDVSIGNIRELIRTESERNDSQDSSISEIKSRISAIETIIVPDENGSVTLPADKITQDPDHLFVNSEQLDNINSIPDKANAFKFKVTVPTTSWVGEKSPYTSIISKDGITENTDLAMDLIPSSDFEVAKKEGKSYRIYRAITGSNNITLYSEIKPKVDLHLKFVMLSPVKDITG